MELQELIRVFNEVLNQDRKLELTSETDFKELDEWSSLTAFNIVERIETKFDVRLRGIELRRCTTIEDLLNLINTK